MSFGCFNADHLVNRAFEALRCEFGQRIDFQAFLSANVKRAYLVLEIEGRNTQAVVKALRPFAEGMCSKPVQEMERRKEAGKRWRNEFPHMARAFEKGLL